MKHRTRKDRRRGCHKCDWVFCLWKQGKGKLKRANAKRNRLRPITDETPYKRLADPWDYCA
jgi:hypothetical protein